LSDALWSAGDSPQPRPPDHAPTPTGPPATVAAASAADRGKWVRFPLVLVPVLIIAAILGGVVFAASMGNGTSDNPTGQRAAAPATATEPRDTDGDGTPNDEDPNPYSARADEDGGVDDDLSEAPSADEGEPETDEDGRKLPEKIVPVGATAIDDDVTFKVLALEPVQSIATDEYSDPVTRVEGSKLIKAVIMWKNNTDAPLDIFCGGEPAILLDQDERNFQPKDVTLDIAGNETCGEELQPGFKQTVTLAFQMPRESSTYGLGLWNSGSEDDPSGDTFVLFEK
jgi:hypothetical protein